VARLHLEHERLDSLIEFDSFIPAAGAGINVATVTTNDFQKK
jgi:hypothetical protein